MIIILIIAIFYFSLILMFLFGWLRIDNENTKNEIVTNKSEEKISVLIAVKNEEKNILYLLNDLKKQNYPQKKFEVIIIDDFSDDNTFDLATKFCTDLYNFKIIKNFGQKGKKSAIQKGISIAKGKLIITTDADCRVGKCWLSAINNFYQKTNAKMIIAPVVFSVDKKLFTFGNLQALEFLSLQASTAGAVGLNSPIMCNGANLIFEKKLFYEFKDPNKKNIISGDDMFLMLNIKQKYPKQIHFLKDKKAIVTTLPVKNVIQFFNQRIRWSSKSPHYNDFFVIITAIIVFITNFTLSITFFCSIFNILNWNFFLIIFFIKSIIDIPLLFSAGKFFSVKKLMFLFLPLQIIYPFYVFTIGILSFFLKVKWK